MALINKEPYITPDMVTVSVTNFNTNNAYKDTGGSITFFAEKINGVVTLHFPIFSNLTTANTGYEVATIPEGFRPYRNITHRYARNASESYTITISTAGVITIYPLQNGSGRFYLDNVYTYVSG